MNARTAPADLLRDERSADKKTLFDVCEHMFANLPKKATPKASPPERLKWVKTFLSAAATLPTSTMLHVVLERSLERVDEVWECQKFSKYLCRRYLCFAACDVEVYGVDRMRSGQFLARIQFALRTVAIQKRFEWRPGWQHAFNDCRDRSRAETSYLRNFLFDLQSRSFEKGLGQHAREMVTPLPEPSPK